MAEFVAVGIVSSLSDSIPALDLQAATGLVAIIVLLVIMNWFFHKIYWGGWIRAHNRRRKLLCNCFAGKRRRDCEDQNRRAAHVNQCFCMAR